MKKLIYSTILVIFFFNQGYSCTNFLVTKGASKDGSTMISYSADSHVRYGELYFRKGGAWNKNATVKLFDRGSMKFLGEIPQVSWTYNVIGFMNEHQVSIGETTFGGKHELVDTTGMIDYGSLMFLALDRAKTARGAIKVMAELVEKYGYYSSGETFSIADPNEVWIMEIVGKGTEMVYDTKLKTNVNKNKGAVWVAIRIPDGCVSAHANQARITTFPLENKKTSISSKNLSLIYNPDIEVIYADDVIDFARKKAYFTGKDAEFSFSDTYAPMTFDAARFCEARVWSMFRQVNADMDQYLDYAKGINLKHRMPLYIKPNRKLSQADIMNFHRDHYEGTYFDMTKDAGALPFYTPYRWRPMTWNYMGKKYFHERATATQQTGFAFVSQMRSKFPDPIGGIFWFSVDDVASTVYVPIYCGSLLVPETYAVGNGDMLTYSENAAFWVFNKVANFAYLRYDLMIKDIQKVQARLENQYLNLIDSIDKKAMEIYANNQVEARVFLTDFSTKTANETVAEWEKLFQYLLVKYIDGNVKREDDNGFKRNSYGFPVSPIQPEYPDEWKQIIIEKSGTKFLAPE